MKILFVTPSYKPAFIYGGTIVVVAKLAESLVRMGHEVTVYTTSANGAGELAVKTGQLHDVDGVCVYYFDRLTKDHTHASPALWKRMNETVGRFDVVHIHSWWNLLTIGAAWICKRHNIKPVVSPHGMLSPYIIGTNNKSKKQLVHRLIGKRLLQSTFLHVSTELEWEESQQIIHDWPGRIIPNEVMLGTKQYQRFENKVFTIGFLSRIEKKKGVDLLISALSQIDYPYRLLIAGSGEEDYVKSLKELATSCGNSGLIDWVGWKNGTDKFDFLSEVDLFALTSHSENFAVVVIESLSVGTPVLISNQVGLHKFVERNDFGWITELTLNEIVDKLKVIVTEFDKIKRINDSAPIYIEEQFSGINISSQYGEFYDDVRVYNNMA